MIGSFAPTTSNVTGVTLVGRANFAASTQQFLTSLVPGSLTATLYEVPDDSKLMSAAGRIILNQGSQGGEESIKNTNTQAFAQQMLAQGADLRRFSDPSATQRLHAKTYTGMSSGQAVGMVSTGNLSATAFKPVVSRAERIQQAARTQSIFQSNLAVKLTNPNLVAQLSRFQSEASLNRVPHSHPNVLVGGTASSSVVDRLLHAGKGDRVVLSGPYIDDKRVVAALLQAQAKGANVTVISSNPGTKYPLVTTPGKDFPGAIGALQAGGVEVLTPSKDDPLLVHTKALAIVSENGQSSFFLGSHNFTNAAKQDKSVDLLLYLNDKTLAGTLAKELTQNAQDLQLQRYSDGQGQDRMSGVEQRMYLRGSGELYKVRAQIATPLAQSSRVPDAKPTVTDPFMPYYPTKMDSAFFDYFIGKELPKVSIYSDLWKARALGAIPDSVKQLDREMSNPGFGNQINRVLHQKLYQEGLGFIGSTMAGAGRFLDWALGFEALQTQQKDQKHAYAGSMRKLFGLQYAKSDSQQEGPFQQLFTSFYTMAAASATSLAFYVGVNLPLQYAKGALETDYMSFLIQLPERRSPLRDQLANTLRSLTLGPTIGNAFSEVLNDPATTRDNYANKVYDQIFNSQKVSQDINRIAHTSEGKLTQIDLGDEGAYAATQAMRQFDQARFKSTSLQILEAINPYAAGTRYYDMFAKSIRTLDQTVAQTSTIEFKAAADNPNVLEPRFRHVGTERIRTLAKRYDEVAALLPANLAYWAPPLRKALGLEAFDPVQHTTLRDFLSFENATRWTEYFYKRLGNYVSQPVTNLRKSVQAWRQEIQIARTERTLLTAIAGSPLTHVAPVVQQQHQDVQAALLDLQRQSAATYQTKAQELQALINDQRLVAYQQALQQQQQHLEQSPFRTLDATFVPTENPFKPVGSEGRERIHGLKQNLARLGVFLLADQLSDQYLFRSLGANLLTQIRAYKDLNTKDGQVARFEFTGELPRALVLSLQVGAALAVGTLLPQTVDLGERAGSLMRQIPSLRNFQKEVTQQQVTLRQTVTEPIPETLEFLNQRTEAGRNARVYRTLRQQLGSVSNRRVGLRFNTSAALAAAFVTGFALKTAASGVAYGLNWLHHHNEDAVTPGSTDAYFSAMFEHLSVAAMQKAQSRNDFANIALGQTLASKFLRNPAGGERVYTVATQVTTPLFQLPTTIRFDQQKGTAAISIGFQLMPIMGLGTNPLLPFALRLKADQLETQMQTLTQVMPQLFGPLQTAGLLARSMLSFLTFGQGLVYEKDSTFEQSLEFVGLSSALLLTADRLAGMQPRAQLVQRVGESHALVKQLDDLSQNTRAVRQVIHSALSVANKALRFTYSLPAMLVSGTAKGVAAVLPESTRNFLSPRLAQASQPLRRFAPYYLALTMARLLSDPSGGYVGKDFNNPLTQLGATVGTGLAAGFVLDKLGVFASERELAQDFRYVTQQQRLTLDQTKRLLQDSLPNLRTDQQALTGEVDEILQAISQAPSHGSRRWIPSRQLLAGIAAPTLWEEGLRLRDVELSIQAGDLVKTRRLGTGDHQSLGKLPYGELKSLGARFALAALGLGALKAAAFTVANFLPDQVLSGLYKVPILGSTLRLLAGVDPTADKLNAIEGGGMKHGSHPQGLMGLLNQTLSVLSFGTVDLARTSGLYSNESNAFLDVFGPFGLSFKPKRVGSYLQYASSFTDLSVSAYDMVKGGLSSDLVMQTLGILQQGKAKTLGGALAQLRGATPRKRNALYDVLTASELEYAGKSSGIARALRLRQFQVEHLAGQRASELLIDFFKEGYVYGILGSDALPGYRLPSDGYRPLNFIQKADFFIQKNFLTGTAFQKFDPEQNLMTWYGQTEWKSRTVMQAFNALNIGADLNNIQGAQALTTPLSVLMLGTGAYLGLEIAGSLAAHFGRSEIGELVEQSKISQGRNVASPDSHFFRFGNSPVTNKPLVFQVQKLNQETSVYRLPLELEDWQASTGKPYTFLVDKISKGYEGLQRNVSKFFVNAYTEDLATLLRQTAQAPEDLSLHQAQFRESVGTKFERLVTSGYERRLVVGSSVTLFDAMLGSGRPGALRLYVEQSRSLLDQALTEVSGSLNELEAPLREDQLYQAMLSMNKSLEGNQAFQQLLLRIQQPITGVYDQRAEVKAERLYQKATGSTPQTSLRELQTHQQERLLTRTTLESRALQQLAKPWTEGALTTSLKAVKQVGMFVGSWVSMGRSLYELAEAGTVLAGGSSQSAYLRDKAGEQFVTGAVYWGIAEQAAVFAATLGAGPVGAVVFGAAALFGLDFLKARLAPVKQAEAKLTRSLAFLVSHPVASVARVFDHIGLGAPVRAIGNLVATPASFLLQVLTAPLRGLFENITGPLIQDQTFSMSRDSATLQFLKGSLLPRSVYAYFDGNDGRNTFGGKEPFLTGNVSLLLKQKQLLKLQSIINVSTRIDDALVHRSVLGRPADMPYEKMQLERYFESPVAGRVMADFMSNAYTVSTSLRLALERRQVLYDMQVTVAPLKLPPPVADLRLLTATYAAASVLGGQQRQNLSLNVLSQTRQAAQHAFEQASHLTQQALDRVIPWVSAVTAKIKHPLAQSVEQGQDFVGRRVNVGGYLLWRRTRGGLKPPLSALQSFSQKAQGATRSTLDAIQTRFSKSLEALSFQPLQRALQPYVESFADTLLSLTDRSLAVIQQVRSLLPSVRLSLPSVTLPNFRIPSAFQRLSERLQTAFTPDWYQAPDLSVPRPETPTSLKVFLEHQAQQSLPPLRRLAKAQGSALTYLSETVIPRGLKRLGAQFSRIPKGFLPASFLGAMELSVALASDSRFQHLNKHLSFKEYNQAYKETSIGLSGYVLGSLAGAVTRNPLVALVSAIAGGWVTGNFLGDTLSRRAYSKRKEEPNGFVSYLERSALTSAVLNIAQAPKLMESYQLNGLRGLFTQVLRNTGISFLSGVTGAGPMTQVTLGSWAIDLSEHVSKHWQPLARFLQRTKSFLQETPELINFMATGNVSSEVQAAAQRSVSSFVQASETKASVRFRGSQFEFYGSYRGQANAIRLSRAVESTLGRAELGRFVRKGAVARAKFTFYHEVAHSYDLQTGTQLNLEALQDLEPPQLAKAKALLEGLAKESTLTLASRFPLGSNLVQQVYAEELSANVRAFQLIQQQHPEEVTRFVRSLTQETNLNQIQASYAELLQQASSRVELMDPGVRYRLSRSDMAKAIAQDVNQNLGATPRRLLSLLERTPGGKVQYGKLLHALDLPMVLLDQYVAADANRMLKEADRTGNYSQIKAARHEQASVFLGSTLGVATHFATKNGLAPLLVAGVGLKVIPFLLDGGGLFDALAGGDKQRADSGEALINPFDSPSYYVRIHRGYTEEKAVGEVLARPLRQVLKQVSQNFVVRPLWAFTATTFRRLDQFGRAALPLLTTGIREASRLVSRLALSTALIGGTVLFTTASALVQAVGFLGSKSLVLGQTALSLASRAVTQAQTLTNKLLSRVKLDKLYRGLEIAAEFLEEIPAQLLELGGYFTPGLKALAKATTTVARLAVSTLGALSSNVLRTSKTLLGAGANLFAEVARVSGETLFKATKLTVSLLSNVVGYGLRALSATARTVSTSVGFVASTTLRSLGWASQKFLQPLLLTSLHALGDTLSLGLRAGQAVLGVSAIALPVLRLGGRALVLGAEALAIATQGIFAGLKFAARLLPVSVLKFASRQLLALGQSTFNLAGLALQSAWNLTRSVVEPLATASARVAAALADVTMYTLRKTLGVGEAVLSLALKLGERSLKLLTRGAVASYQATAHVVGLAAPYGKRAAGFIINQLQHLVVGAGELLTKPLGTLRRVGRFGLQALGETRRLAPLLLTVAKGAAQVIPLAMHVAQTAITKSGALGRLLMDGAMQSILKLTPNLGKRILTLGYRETILNLAAPVIDLFTFGQGVSKALNLNAYSSLKDVQDAYQDIGTGQGGLVGSVFGAFAGGPLSDAVSSVFGQLIGAQTMTEKAKQRFESRDYGLAPVLEDAVHPLLRNLVIAQAAGTQAARLSSRILTPTLAKLLSADTRLGRLATAAKGAYETSLAARFAEASTRFTRVVGTVPESGVLRGLIKAGGYLPKAASHILNILGPVIDIGMFAYGASQATHARTEAEYQVSIQRTTGSLGSIGGGLLGMGLGGPITGVALSLAGDFLFRRIGQDLASRAKARNVKASRVVTGEGIGAVAGVVVGGLVTAGLVAGGVVAGLAAAPVLLVAAGVGLLAGAVIGAYSALVGSRKQTAQATKLELKSGAKEATFKLGDTLNFGLAALANLVMPSAVAAVAPQALETTRQYLAAPNPEQKTLSQQILQSSRNPLHPREQSIFGALGQAAAAFMSLTNKAIAFARQQQKLMAQIATAVGGPLAGVAVGLAGTAADLLLGGSAESGSADYSRLGPQFLGKTNQVAQRLRMRPEYLLAIMAFESGGTFSPSKQNMAGSGATGLIQFMPDTARDLGTSTAALASMSAVQQLDYVEKYLKPYAGKLNTVEDAYMAVLFPAAIGRGSAGTLFKRGDPYYAQNSGLDANRDGVVTVGEAAAEVRKRLPRSSSEVGSVGSTSTGQRVAQQALLMAGREFQPGLAEQCANFVRYVLKQAGANVGVTRSSLDQRPTGGSLASGFFGKDLGQIITDRKQLQPGDLLAFGGTYGGYSKNTITHVGIYVGDGMIVDRSTSSKPVSKRSINTFEGSNSGFLYALRPSSYGSPSPRVSLTQTQTQSQAQTRAVGPNQAPASVAGGSPSLGRPYLRLTRSPQRDQYGGYFLNLSLINAKGQQVEQLRVVSGSPSHQQFRRMAESQSGSFEPVPEGTYSLGAPDWAGGKGNTGSYFNAGLGPMFIPVNPNGPSARAAIGIHLDANRATSPGTAGCIGLTEVSQVTKVADWVEKYGANSLVVDYNLKSLPAKYRGSVASYTSNASTTQGTGTAVKVAPVGSTALNTAQAYQLAVIATLEAPTRMGKLDVAQSIFNRLNSGRLGGPSYGNNITSILFAPQQYEPFFGVSPNQVQGRDSAINLLKRRGYSAGQAQAALDTFFIDAGDPAKMADARRHVGGRTDYKGTTQVQNRVASEDPQRSPNENFFHISSGQSYAFLKKLEGVGPKAVSENGMVQQVAEGSPAEAINNAVGSITQSLLNAPSAISKAVYGFFVPISQQKHRRTRYHAPTVNKALLKANAAPLLPPKKVALAVQFARQQVAQASDLMQKHLESKTVALHIQTHNPAAEARQSTMSADTTRPAQRQALHQTNVQKKDGSVQVEVDTTLQAYLHTWEQVTGMTRSSEYLLMDSAMG